ncbi:MAG: hypothetical protein KGL99_07150 [Burkholderiales bacterium]|nr:hypothetical protein [Burkholderiales bacterium]MDE2626911.1 hypothetical protein [Burkholderiales bacterium]
MRGARWDAVDLEYRRAGVHLDEAKAWRAIPVPLNDDAMAAVQERFGKPLELVVRCRGKPIRQVSIEAFYAALPRAGIEDSRRHALRHNWAVTSRAGPNAAFALQELRVGSRPTWCAALRPSRWITWRLGEDRLSANKNGGVMVKPSGKRKTA